RPFSSRGLLLQLALPILVLLAVMVFGWKRLYTPEPAGRELKLALVQPSIPQVAIWDPAEKTNRFNKLVALSQQAAAAHPDILVWPEAALPNLLTRFNPLTYAAVTNLVLPNQFWMILGADDAETQTNSKGAFEAQFFNSAFLVDRAGQLVARYHKRRLVMFGEYLPLARWFPWLNHLRSVDGGFTSGQTHAPFDLKDVGAKAAVLICFEDV